MKTLEEVEEVLAIQERQVLGLSKRNGLVETLLRKANRGLNDAEDKLTVFEQTTGLCGSL